jgi:hypothetical protein
MERHVRNITERGTFAMECTRDPGRCEVEGVSEFFFRDCQHSFHPRHGAISFRRLFEVLENLADELRVLDGSGPHWTSELHKGVRRWLSLELRDRDPHWGIRLTWRVELHSGHFSETGGPECVLNSRLTCPLPSRDFSTIRPRGCP